MAKVEPTPGFPVQFGLTVRVMASLLVISRCCPAPAPVRMVTVDATHWLSIQFWLPSSTVLLVLPEVVAVAWGGATILYPVVALGVVVQFGVTVSWLAVLVRMVRCWPTPWPLTRYAVQPPKAFGVQVLVVSVSVLAVAAVAVPVPLGAAG